MKKRWLQFGLLVLVVYLSFCAITGIFVAETALHPVRHSLNPANETQAQAWAKDDDATLSEINITAGDGILLQAWELRPEDANGHTVVLLHGLKGNRREMVNYADMLLTHG